VLGFAKTAMLDERGWYWQRRPGGGLDQVFGAREARIDVVKEPIDVEIPASPLLPGWAGGRVTGAWHRQALEITGAEVLGRFADGTPAFTHRRHGQGSAWLAGTHLDVGVIRYGGSSTGWLLAAVARAAGGEPLFSTDVAGDGLPRTWARLRRSGREALLSVTTTAREGATLTATVRAERATDLLSGESYPVLTDRLIVHVPPMGARLIHLEGIDA
jgi:hypothetical protein